MWVKLSKNGRTIWANTSLVRRIEADYGSGSKLFYTSKDFTSVDQSADTVLIAMGYQVPQEQAPETHEEEDVGKVQDVSQPPLTYPVLVAQALNEANHPLSFRELCAYVAKYRQANSDSIASMLASKDAFQKVHNGAAWWFVDRPLPGGV